jgi:hypothetical protein
MESVDAVKKTLVVFDKAEHTEITAPKAVEDFGGDDLATAPADGELPPLANDEDFQL